jgi:recombination protein RecR
MLSSLIDIIRTLSKIPTFGPRLATRTVFYLLSDSTKLSAVSSALASLTHFERCPSCFFFKPVGAECSLCSDVGRNLNKVILVEKETDVLTFEQNKITNGRYFILGELLEGASFSQEGESRLKSLESEIGNLKLEELVLALPPNALGDATSKFLVSRLSPYFKKISRLARGLPTGAEVEFADQETLKQAFEDRK